MLKIGDFSKLSRVSIRMLRYYDEIGLLHPVHIDCFTGYRYYSEEQLLQIGRITSLRDMGFGLAAIRTLLTCYDDHTQLDAALQQKQQELLAHAQRTAQQLRLLETARERLRKDTSMNYDVTIKTLPERYAACVRMTLPHYADEGRLWQTLRDETQAMQLIPDDPCYCSVTYLDGEYKEQDVECEAQKTVKGHYPDTEHVTFRTLPAVTFASTLYKGPYDAIIDAYTAITSWITDNDYDFAGCMFNIYHVNPHDTSNPDEFVTEICYPVKPR